MDTVTLSSKGQLVIPKAVRDHAQVVPGSRFSVHYVDGEIRLRPLARPGRKRQSDAQTRTAIRTRLKARNAP
jgi:AbrB family looped-hinge helix DNA binding protein